MTTVSSALSRRRTGDTDHPPDDFPALVHDGEAAERFVATLLEAARAARPDHSWTADDLADVLQAARRAREGAASVLQGRDFRKRLREQISLSDRLGDAFTCVILTVRAFAGSSAYGSVLDALVEKLRRTDMVFAYRHRFAIILPRMTPGAVDTLLERIRRLLEATTGEADIVELLLVRTFPSADIGTGQGDRLLDWAEDALRDVP